MSALKVLIVTFVVGHAIRHATGWGWSDAEFYLMIMCALLMMGLGAWLESGYQEKRKKNGNS